MGTRGKAWLRHDTDHSPQSSVEVKNELEELSLLSTQASPWHVVGQLYFILMNLWVP
jgi:hypothetical protein